MLNLILLLLRSVCVCVHACMWCACVWHMHGVCLNELELAGLIEVSTVRKLPLVLQLLSGEVFIGIYIIKNCGFILH